MSTNGTQNGISFTKAYATSDGKTFGNICDAKRNELNLVFDRSSLQTAQKPTEQLLDAMIEQAQAIIDILSTTEKSRPKARKSHGAIRKPKTPAST